MLYVPFLLLDDSNTGVWQVTQRKKRRMWRKMTIICYIYKLDSNVFTITTSYEVLRCPQTCLSTKMKTFSGYHSTHAFLKIKADIKHSIIYTLPNKGYYLLYVGSAVMGKAIALTFLALGCLIFQRSDPAAVVDCWLSLFSLKCNTASWVLKWQQRPEWS